MSKDRLKSSLRKFYGRYGDLTKQYEVPLSRMLHDILDDDHIQWHPPLIGHYTNFWPLPIWTLLPNLTFYLIVQGFHRTYATGAACQQRTLTPPDTWSCPTLGTCMCSNVETNLSCTCLVSRTFEFWTPLGTILFCLNDSKVTSEVLNVGQQTDRQTDRQTWQTNRSERTKTICPRSFDPGA